MNVLSALPGQKISIVLDLPLSNGYYESLNVGYSNTTNQTDPGYNDGFRVNSDALPVISRIILPALTVATGFPQPMTKLDVGLYIYTFQIPNGTTALGTYLIDVSFAINAVNFKKLYQLNVTMSTANFSMS